MEWESNFHIAHTNHNKSSYMMSAHAARVGELWVAQAALLIHTLLFVHGVFKSA